MSDAAQAFVEILPDFSRFGETLGAGVEGPLGAIQSKITSALGMLPGGPVVAGVAAGAVAIGAALAGIGEKFQKSFNQIRSDTGATGKVLDGLDASFKQILASGPDSANAVTSVMDLLYQRTGLTGKALDGLSETELELARITGQDVKSQVDATTQAFANWNITGVAPTKAALEQLLGASQSTGVSVDTIAGLVSGKAGAAFRSLGTSIGGAATVMANLQAAGVPAQAVITGLGKVIADAAKSGVDSKTALADLFKTLQAGTPVTADMANAVKELGSRNFSIFSDAVKTGKIQLQDFQSEGQGTVGAIDRIAEANLTLGQRFDELKNKALVALQPLASGVLKGIEGGLVAAEGAVSKFAAAFQAGFSGSGTGGLTGVSRVFADLGAETAKDLPKLEAFAQQAIPQIEKAVQSALPTIEKLATIFATDVVPIMIKVDGLIGGNFVSTLKIAADVIKAIGDVLSGNFSGALSDLGDAFGNVGDIIKRSLGGIGDLLSGVFGGALQAVGNFAARLPELILQGVTAALSSLERFIEGVPVVGQVFDAVKLSIQVAWQVISAAVTTAWSVLQPIFATIVTVVKTMLEVEFVALTTVVQDSWTVIAAAVTTAWGVIKPVWDLMVAVMKATLEVEFLAFKVVAATVWLAVQTAVAAAWAVIKPIFDLIGSIVTGIIIPAFNLAMSVAKTAWSAVSSAISAAWGVVEGPLGSLANVVGTVIVGAFNTIKTISETVWSAVSTAITTMWGIAQGPLNLLQGVLSGIGNVLNTIVQGAQDAANFISKIKPPSFHLPFGLAGGSDSAAAGVTLVGERGPELVQFAGGERVYPADQTAGILSKLTSSLSVRSAALPVPASSGASSGGQPAVQIGQIVFQVPPGVDPQPYADAVTPKLVDAFTQVSIQLRKAAA